MQQPAALVNTWYTPPVMCGRYSLVRVDEAALRRFDLFGLPADWVAHYNVAPTVPALIVRMKKESTEREAVMARFGLIPPWSNPASAAKMINARAETVAEKPAYREALLARRCLIPADGFFEWRRSGAAKKGKQPYWFQMADERPFAFAGLWERWYDPAGQRVESFAILTTRPNALVAPFHDRMPVILSQEAHALWLDPEVRAPPLLEPLYEPIPAERMIVRAVSRRVNDARNDDPSCLELVKEDEEEPPKQGSLF
ncbi:MAG: SOS response-associated peptidase [Myxococcota bacterium]